jgi:hypothetical protein
LNHLCLSWRIFHGLAAIPLCQRYLLSDDKSMRRRFHQRLKLLYGILRVRRAYPATYQGGYNCYLPNPKMHCLPTSFVSTPPNGREN